MGQLLRAWRLCCALLLISAITACGGGGGGSGGPPAGDSDHGDFRFASSIEQASIERVATPVAVSVHPYQPMSRFVWFKVEDSAGVLDAEPLGISSNGDFALTLHVTEGTPVGTHVGSVRILAYDDQAMTQVHPGSPWTVPYRVTVHPRHVAHRIQVSRLGVGLSEVPGRAHLSDTLTVSDNLDRSTAWQASSDRAWLGVTPSGTTGSGTGLTLTADPAGLTPDTVHTATVTVRSSDTSVTNSETIRVALWVGTTAPTRMSPVEPIEDVRQVLTDPSAPWVYLVTPTFVRKLNVYTGATIGNIASGIEDLGAAALSDDGTRLFAVDDASDRVLVFDTLSQVRVATWNLPTNAPQSRKIQYMRSNGQGVLFLSDGLVINANDGSVLVTAFAGDERSGVMTTGADGRSLFAMEPLTAGITRYEVDWTDSVLGEQLVVQKRATMHTNDTSNANGLDLAATLDGQRLYTVSGGIYAVTAFDIPNGAYRGVLDGGDDYRPSAIEVSRDGRVYSCTGSSLNTYSAGGALMSSSLLHNAGSYHACSGPHLAVTADAGVAVLSLSGMPVGRSVLMVPVGQ
ncbi:MAG: hypothetical protein ACOZJX_11755 [Pseudomonadota bacterium]